MLLFVDYYKNGWTSNIQYPIVIRVKVTKNMNVGSSQAANIRRAELPMLRLPVWPKEGLTSPNKLVTEANPVPSVILDDL